MRFKKQFPIAFRDHYGFLHVFFSAEGSRDFWKSYEDFFLPMEGEEEEEPDEENKRLYARALETDTEEAWFDLLYNISESPLRYESLELVGDISYYGLLQEGSR